MSDTVEVPTQYFVRKLTRELAADLVGDASQREAADKSETGLDRFLAGAQQMGVAVSEMLDGFLHHTKVKNRPYRTRSGGTVTRNLYGYFLIVEKAGQIDICRTPDTYTFPKGANVYIVADLAGMPIARLKGTARGSNLSVASGVGQRSDAEYIVDLWLDPGEGKQHELTPEAKARLGKFLSQVVGTNDSLTIAELEQVARQRLQPFFDAMLDVPVPGNAWVMGQSLPDHNASLETAIRNFQQNASEYLGLSLSIRFRPGTKVFPHSVFLSEEMRATAQQYATRTADAFDKDGNWQCQNAACVVKGGAPNTRQSKFCTECGRARPAATAEARAERAWQLVTKDGQDLNIELKYLSYNVEAVDEDGITTACIDALWKECRKVSVEDLERQEIIDRLGLAVNEKLTAGPYGNVGEFKVVYFDTADSEWKRQVRARIREQLRDVEKSVAQFEVTDGLMALREMQLLRDRSDIAIVRKELELGLERARAEATNTLAHEQLQELTEVQRDKMKLQSELEKRRTAAQAAGEEMRFTRDVEQQQRSNVREDEVQDASNRRSDELSDLTHDLSKDDMVLAAQRKAVQDAAEIQARIDRLKSGVKFDDSRAAQDLELGKKQRELELEAERLKLQSHLEIAKLQAMAQIEAAQRDQQSKMSAAQLMALQASSIAASGAAGALEKLASHDGVTAEATAEAKVAKMQAEMLERMMAMQMQLQAAQTDASKEAMAQQLEIMKLAMQQQQATTATAITANQEIASAAAAAQQAANAVVRDAHKKTADSAVEMGERSLGAMANVAASKAANPAAAGQGAAGPKVCPSCKLTISGKVKFCNECGYKLGE